jgi:hypothetical protein
MTVGHNNKSESEYQRLLREDREWEARRERGELIREYRKAKGEIMDEYDAEDAHG